MSQLSLGPTQYHTQYVGGPGSYPSAAGALYTAQGGPLIQQVAMNGSNGAADLGGSGSSSVGPPDDIGNHGKGQQSQTQQPYQVVCSQSK